VDAPAIARSSRRTRTDSGAAAGAATGVGGRPSTGAMKRYPRRGNVSTNRGRSAESPSASRILLIAMLSIVLFVVIFSARHRWDMNEQRYKELLYKKQKEQNTNAENKAAK